MFQSVCTACLAAGVAADLATFENEDAEIHAAEFHQHVEEGNHPGNPKEKPRPRERERREK